MDGQRHLKIHSVGLITTKSEHSESHLISGRIEIHIESNCSVNFSAVLGKPEPFSSFDLYGLFFHPSTSSFVLNVVRFPCHQLWLRWALTLCCTSVVVASFMWKHLCSSLVIFLGFFGTFLFVTSVVFLELLFGRWTSELLLLFSSHFYSFCFLPLGSFHVFFYSSTAVCVGGWG